MYSSNPTQIPTVRYLALLLATSGVLLCGSGANAQKTSSGWIPPGIKDSASADYDATVFVPPSAEEVEAKKRLQEARNLIALGKYDKALPILLVVDKIWHDRVFGATPLLARVYFELGRDTEAVSQFEKIFYLTSGNNSVHWMHSGDTVGCFRYATVLARTGNANLATEIYNMGLGFQLPNESSPILAPVVFDNSPYKVRYTAKRMEAAARLQVAREQVLGEATLTEPQLNKVLALEPDNAAAHFYRGLVYARKPIATMQESKESKAKADSEFRRAESLGRANVRQAVADARKCVL